MKQILSLWDACPQGGKHRRSVFLRLLLLVCMLATASAGWAETKTYYAGTETGKFSASSVINDSPVTLTTKETESASLRQIWKNGGSNVTHQNILRSKLVKAIRLRG